VRCQQDGCARLARLDGGARGSNPRRQTFQVNRDLPGEAVVPVTLDLDYGSASPGYTWMRRSHGEFEVGPRRVDHQAIRIFFAALPARVAQSNYILAIHRRYEFEGRIFTK